MHELGKADMRRHQTDMMTKDEKGSGKGLGSAKRGVRSSSPLDPKTGLEALNVFYNESVFAEEKKESLASPSPPM